VIFQLLYHIFLNCSKLLNILIKIVDNFLNILISSFLYFLKLLGTLLIFFPFIIYSFQRVLYSSHLVTCPIVILFFALLTDCCIMANTNLISNLSRMCLANIKLYIRGVHCRSFLHKIKRVRVKF